MSGFTPTIDSEFAGIDAGTLRQWLTQAQNAKNNLVCGQLTQTVTYGMAGEQRTVTYTRTNIAELDMRIRSLARALGLVRHRRALPVSFAGRR